MNLIINGPAAISMFPAGCAFYAPAAEIIIRMPASSACGRWRCVSRSQEGHTALLCLDEGQDLFVDHDRMNRHHPVRIAPIQLKRAVFDQLGLNL